jgi:His-Xaa-Ser system protein HxsD
MLKISFPITQICEDSFLIKANLDIYNKEAVVAACYKFSGVYFVHQDIDDNAIAVTLQSKDGHIVTEEIAKSFCNELIDQQVRYNTNQQFGHIRDLIVEEAFRPVNKNL